ncbi:putative T7SS-secreted protein [Streptomyces sp. FIT100]|uniref:putative T7SS-secreted protein n=1 Tax=Streptomyces sp. FIT100 TaxID=2837956 RepID=UPI0021C98149|nr:hypothetical protein [Streptomyces sp. FIT100]UUN27461.1 hypothetical protein KK483_14425 [Streptomyces sp. FIT100]
MGWRDFVPDVVEDKAEDVVEGVGDGVEWLGDKTADLAEEAGWDGGADWIRDKSRSAANYLGADVAELELGQSEDPKKLVHGSVSTLRSTVTHLEKLQSAFDKVGEGLRGVDADGFRGEASSAFREASATQPPKWFKAADAFEKAAGAVSRFAETVEWAQGQARDAIAEYDAARKLSQDARAAYNARVDEYNTAVEARKDTLPPRPSGFTDPGTAKANAAQDKLDEARRQRNEAAETARSAVRAARDMAPPKPSYAEQAEDGFVAMAIDANHLVGGVVKGTAGFANFVRSVNPLDPYNLTHPAEFAMNLNSTAAGLVTAVNNPVGTARTMVDEFMKDPSEGIGKLIPELVGSKGMGALKKAATAAKYADDVKPPGLGPKGGAAADEFDNLASRGSGEQLPSFDEVKRAVVESKPEVLARQWPDDDGRYYASRVLKGGRPDGETVLAGHGYIEGGAGEVTVPPGTSVSFYVAHGERIPGLNGVAVEGGSYPGPAVETFGPGDRIPNYTLAPPEAKGQGGFTVYENSTTVAQRTMLGELLKEGMGNIHWAACREFK